MRFFLDASVPDSVGQVLSAAGHEVIYHREALEEGVKDPVVCQTASANDAILVAVDKDMKQLTRRFGSRMSGSRTFPWSFAAAVSQSPRTALNRLFP
ncbi:DUF5615 family PIN-like protein [Rhizobium laguerreae]|uniref:DUF5615 family PIN-like protein n=1 Tax=Rhizobium laguerreae TaxID=1076926 RepID=UPI001442222A|nr:DUF5615 family PIN-like protein [Rhizobium laguerreae]NKM31476.1 hypothetical protein [Rhizobium laguerreae]